MIDDILVELEADTSLETGQLFAAQPIELDRDQ
jgi:hypothetical protein